MNTNTIFFLHLNNQSQEYMSPQGNPCREQAICHKCLFKHSFWMHILDNKKKHPSSEWCRVGSLFSRREEEGTANLCHLHMGGHLNLIFNAWRRTLASPTDPHIKFQIPQRTHSVQDNGGEKQQKTLNYFKNSNHKLTGAFQRKNVANAVFNHSHTFHVFIQFQHLNSSTRMQNCCMGVATVLKIQGLHQFILHEIYKVKRIKATQALQTD